MNGNLSLFPEQPDFTVDLDDQWVEWGYKQKKDAVGFLQRNFVEGKDYFRATKVISGKGQPRKIYMLKEDCAFEMAKVIQTKDVLDFKNKKLEQLSNPENVLGDMPLALLSKVTIERLSEAVSALQNQAVIDRPKVQAYEKLIDSSGLMSLADAAKVLGTGRNRLIEYLRSKKILYRSHGDNVPYQRFIDQGYFEVKVKPLDLGFFSKVTKVTSKGLDWLGKEVA